MLFFCFVVLLELQNRLENKDTLIQALRNESDTRIWGVDKICAQYRDIELDRSMPHGFQQECKKLKVAATHGRVAIEDTTAKAAAEICRA
jgi:hypothetical protein